jgi:hypothetical protein
MPQPVLTKDTSRHARAALTIVFLRELSPAIPTWPGIRQVAGAWSAVRPDAGGGAAADRAFAGNGGAARHQRTRRSHRRFRARCSAERAVARHGPFAANYGAPSSAVGGQLGDGRAITLGEAIGAAWATLGTSAQGRGPDAVFAHADGRAVLRSSIREFLCSEAMHHLGVPTTRALSLVATGEAWCATCSTTAIRARAGAIVCRVAPSFIRFGNFELP